MSERDKDIARIAKMYTKYLNGPLGNGVMDHLQEGESFTIKPYDKIVEIHKQQGRAVVKILDTDKRDSPQKTL
ncbi:MAG: hypothetical protein ACW98U_11165 [Candidatus Thorarchaeota archaeon]|jgi:hypothetical protein